MIELVCWNIRKHHKGKNQRVENTDVAFVKGPNERNESFENIEKKNIMYDEQVQTNRAKD